ncbi:MAG TPA: hypothetical protein EYG70_07700, partial [Sulfurimonas sp.]|nr:hypothetical protein [Sulfurimonas sp.]
MAADVAKVLSVDGTFYIKGSDGSLSELTKGSLVPQDAVVVGADGNSVTNSIIFALGDGTDLVLLGQNTQIFDNSLIDVAFSTDETVTSSENIQKLFNQSDDETADDVTQNSSEETQTEAGEETTSSDSSVESKFAEIANKQETINVTLADSNSQENQTQSTEQTDEIMFDLNKEELHTILVDELSNLQEVQNDAILASSAAAQAATQAELAAQLLEVNPRPQNIRLSELA